MKEAAGYRVPVHRAIMYPPLLGGAPRQFTILNATIFGALALGLQVWWAVIPGVALHLFAVRYARRDRWFFECLLRHLKLARWYDR